jgi:hypothetical protein
MTFTVHKLLGSDRVAGFMEVQNVDLTRSADDFLSNIDTELDPANITTPPLHDALVQTATNGGNDSQLNYTDVNSLDPDAVDPNHVLMITLVLGVSCFLFICWLVYATCTLVRVYKERKLQAMEDQQETHSSDPEDRLDLNNPHLTVVDARPSSFLPTFLRRNRRSDTYYKPMRLIKTS